MEQNLNLGQNIQERVRLLGAPDLQNIDLNIHPQQVVLPLPVPANSGSPEANAVNKVSKTLNDEYDKLVGLMNDVGFDGTANSTYVIGGITIQGDISKPGTAVGMATGVANQQNTMSQLTDGIMKISQMKKAISQKIG